MTKYKCKSCGHASGYHYYSSSKKIIYGLLLNKKKYFNCRVCKCKQFEKEEQSTGDKK